MKSLVLGRLMIDPPEIFTRGELLKKVEAVLKGGGSPLLFRDSTASQEDFRETAQALQPIAARHETPFIVCDRVEIARQIDADGIHLQRWDPSSVAELRRQLGSGKLLGVDIPADSRVALEAERAGADYLRIGPVDAYATQGAHGQITLSTLCEICRGLSRPLYAYGGISLSTFQRVFDVGVYGIALISNAYDAEDPISKTRLFVERIAACAKRSESGQTVTGGKH
ncbi:MAG: thiamine phosphate synthase [Acidobacteriota bacterium]